MVIIPQDKSRSKEANRRILHNEYVFFTDFPVDASQSLLDRFIDALEDQIGDEIWDISILYDYTAQAPNGSEGVTTIKFCTLAALDDVYEIVFNA